MPEGFGKPAKSKSGSLKNYTFHHKSSDGCLDIVKIQASSREEAVKEFESFVRDLEFALSVAPDQEVWLRLRGWQCD